MRREDFAAGFECEHATVVTFTLEPTTSGTRLSLVQSGFKPDQKQASGGARSIAFTVTVIANFVVLSQGEPPAWLTYSPLLPLALLLFTGLYLFALPYLGRRRGGVDGEL